LAPKQKGYRLLLAWCAEQSLTNAEGNVGRAISHVECIQIAME